jgi:hypothetical protein
MQGLLNVEATFKFPLHPVDWCGTKGLILIIDDLWPDLQTTWTDLIGPQLYSVFSKRQNFKVPEDKKLLVILIPVD